MRRRPFLALLPLVACAPSYKAVPPGEARAGRVVLTATAGWNAFSAPNKFDYLEAWTIDGPLLDQLHVYSAVEPGKPLTAPPAGSRAEPVPPYRAGMGPDEIVELYFTSMDRIGAMRRAELTRIEPAPLGGHPGFRFAFRAAGADDLELEGVGQGAVVGDRLYLLVFRATALHHFGLRRPEVERLFAGARLAT